MSRIFKINIKGSSVTKEKIDCTGHQISIILNEIKDLTESYIWYAADILAPGQHVIELFSEPERKQVPLKIGTTDDLITFVSSVRQFERGLFLAVDKSLKNSISWRPDEFDTEDLDYIEPSMLMIRAFDTSYFEILSKETDIIDRLTGKFSKDSGVG